MKEKDIGSHTEAFESLMKAEGLDLSDEENHLVSKSHSNGITAAIAALLISSNRLKTGLDEHSQALVKAAESSDQYSRQLGIAT